ncbi:S-layer homology domain-containing protein [Paenibacillus kobensis]|uniref:S-layer homology domain-containing protein n=1 Tax=Paenibacillus kobensis TaxID=59841 RepID=UPI0013E40BAD|nr:S-layer homology domain-containing protein [Paenibacillus kobensis]
MRRWTAIGTLSAMLLASSVGPVFTSFIPSAHAAQAVAFNDISKHWGKATIESMVTKGILDGFPDGSFRPNDPVKIDQFVKMLILSNSEQLPNGNRSWKSAFLSSLSEDNRTVLSQDYRYYDFKPSMTGYWAKPYIDVASDLHFLNRSRYSDFQANMTRENVAEVLYYTLQETEYLEDEAFSRSVAQAYGDLTSASDRMQRFISEVLVKGIMQGYPDGRFGVGEIVTRAEALVILNRLTDPSARIPVAPSADKLQRLVPTTGGGQKVIVFPDKRMWDAYDSLLQAGKLRGTNYDVVNTTLRLFKDLAEKNAVQSSSSASAVEEADIWLDPAYNTYGITVRLREGTLARNNEAITLFANQLFGYNAFAFNKWFAAVCAEVEAGRPLASKQITIGTDNVSVLVDNTAKTVVFSVAASKG